MNVRLSQKKNRFKKFCPDFAYNHSTPATNEGCTGFLLQRQLNPAELICKLALVDGLQGPEIIGVYPKTLLSSNSKHGESMTTSV